MGSLMLILACALWGVCLARPSNTTIYDCMTGDDCKNENATWSSVGNNTVYCCQRGDGISISYRSKGFTVYSSNRADTNDTSDDESDDSNEIANQEGDRKRNYSVEFTCKCGDVDNKEVENKIKTYFNKMFHYFRHVYPQFWFP